VNQPVGSGSGSGSGDGIHTLKALVLIVVVVVIGWAVLHHTTKPSHGTSSSATSPTTAPRSSTTVPGTSTPTTTTPVIPPSSVKLQVLNGVGSGQLSTEWSNKLKANPGYNTLAPANATATVPKSEIYIVTPGYQREADALAVTVGLTAAAINPTVPPPASAPIPTTARTNANLVLVIGPDLASSA
jgi:LytR cell envelope-related transcriptional attenuator